jgi:hypothetical protein
VPLTMAPDFVATPASVGVTTTPTPWSERH